MMSAARHALARWSALDGYGLHVLRQLTQVPDEGFRPADGPVGDGDGSRFLTRESEHRGPARAAGAQHQDPLPPGLDAATLAEGPDEPAGIGVVPCQAPLILHNRIHGADPLRPGLDLVDQAHHGLLVGHRNVGPQEGVAPQLPYLGGEIIGRRRPRVVSDRQRVVVEGGLLEGWRYRVGQWIAEYTGVLGLELLPHFLNMPPNNRVLSTWPLVRGRRLGSPTVVYQ